MSLDPSFPGLPFMLVLNQVSLRRGVKLVLDQASVVLQPGEKVGLVGRNGAGKSSLFSLLTHRLQSDAGDVSMPPRWRIGEVAQEMPETGQGATDFVLEAAVERIDIKRQLFADLDEAAPEHVILATNSSTIPSSLLMDATARPDRVCNMHFFNPALVMNCVEVVRNPQTSDATVEAALGMVHRLGKQPVRLNKEIPGFVANRLLGALRNEALRLEADGVASYQDIDVAARTALGHPMGPFELMDLVGVDVSYLIRLSEYEQSGDPADLPHPSVQKLYEQGRYGRKNGRGWYEYAG